MILKDENVCRNEWKVARIEEVYKDSDTHVRTVKLFIGDKQLCKNGRRLHSPSFLTRPIQKLVLLLESEQSEESPSGSRNQ